MITRKFYKILSNINGSVALITWMPSSENMSKNDLLEHFKTINSFINVDYTRILFIDTGEFKSHVKISFIKELLMIIEPGPDPLKWIFYSTKDKFMKILFLKLNTGHFKHLERVSRYRLFELYNELIRS